MHLYLEKRARLSVIGITARKMAYSHCVSLTNRISRTSSTTYSIQYALVHQLLALSLSLSICCITNSPMWCELGDKSTHFVATQKKKNRELIEQITYAYWIAICDTSNSNSSRPFLLKFIPWTFAHAGAVFVISSTHFIPRRSNLLPKMKQLNWKRKRVDKKKYIYISAERRSQRASHWAV